MRGLVDFPPFGETFEALAANHRKAKSFCLPLPECGPGSDPGIDPKFGARMAVSDGAERRVVIPDSRDAIEIGGIDTLEGMQAQQSSDNLDGVVAVAQFRANRAVARSFAGPGVDHDSVLQIDDGDKDHGAHAHSGAGIYHWRRARWRAA